MMQRLAIVVVLLDVAGPTVADTWAIPIRRLLIIEGEGNSTPEKKAVDMFVKRVA